MCIVPLSLAHAQEEPAKQYLPEEGDIAIGIDVAPLFRYVGNLFNGSTDNTLESLGGEPFTEDVDGFDVDDIQPDVSIMGKYMLTDNWALRANIGLMIRSNTTKIYVADDAAILNNPLSEDKLIDRRNMQRHGMSAMLGAEYHRGSRRIQGIFGAGVLVGFNKQVTKYTYANALTSINQYPTSAWGTMNANGYRTLTNKSASNIFLGLYGSVGVEWFVAPKLALGAEVNLALYYVRGGQEYAYSEGYNVYLSKVDTRYDIVSPGDSAFRFGTENLGGSLYMSFYF